MPKVVDDLFVLFMYQFLKYIPHKSDLLEKPTSSVMSLTQQKGYITSVTT